MKKICAAFILLATLCLTSCGNYKELIFTIPNSDEKITMSINKEWYVLDTSDGGDYSIWFSKSEEEFQKSSYYGFFRVVKRANENDTLDDIVDSSMSDYMKSHPEWYSLEKTSNNMVFIKYDGQYPNGSNDKNCFIIYSNAKNNYYLFGYFPQLQTDYETAKKLANSIKME